MIQRIRVFYNKHEDSHEEIKRKLDETRISYSMLPTSGPYTLHLVTSTNTSVALGPTAVKNTLNRLLEREGTAV